MPKILIILITFLTALAQKKDNFGLEVNSYVLSLQYKPYHCNKNNSTNKFCSVSDRTKWVINGFWPNNKENGFVTFCSTRAFTLDKVKKIKDQLERLWANYESDTNIDIYKSQWEKHGSCVDFKKLKVNSDREEFYFNKAIQLRNNYNLDFQIKNISLRDLNTQIAKNFKGRKIQIICQKDQSNDKFQIIEEIRLLFDQNFALIDYLKQDNCQKSLQIKFEEEKKIDKKDEM
jgi:ribonuclease I